MAKAGILKRAGKFLFGFSKKVKKGLKTPKGARRGFLRNAGSATKNFFGRAAKKIKKFAGKRAETKRRAGLGRFGRFTEDAGKSFTKNRKRAGKFIKKQSQRKGVRIAAGVGAGGLALGGAAVAGSKFSRRR